MKFFTLPENTRRDIFIQTGLREGLPAATVEKDWWVTLVLHLVFSLDISDHLLFKGGTSLSKGWSLIGRFSEDIDLAIDKSYLGFSEKLSKNQVRNKLRKRSYDFVVNELFEWIKLKLKEWNVPYITLEIHGNKEPDTDPMTIGLMYRSITEPSLYLVPRVLIETGARSQKEPFSYRNITSLVDLNFSTFEWAHKGMNVPAVLPERTFLEKAFLLHEEFQKPGEKMRTERLSRHLYDLEKLMDTEHGRKALENVELYKSIIAHRKIYFPIGGIDYNNHSPEKIDFIPGDDIRKVWEADYNKMRESMVVGPSLDYNALIDRLNILKERFRDIKIL